MNDKLVSILCPAWNAAAYIGEMIESIIGQTYTNWELIVVDDCSKDTTSDIANHYATRDGRIRVCRDTLHRGYAVAFTTALNLARGSIIARQDADDVSKSNRLQRQVEFLQDHRIVTCGGMRLLPNGSFTMDAFCGMEPGDYVKCGSPRGPCNASIVAPREVYDTVGGFHADMEWSADSDWNFRALSMDNPPIEWVHIHENMYVHRQHSEQMTKRGRKQGSEVFRIGQKHYGKRILARLGVS